MKTSNKLLIALAALLLIIPIIVIAVNIKMNYKSAENILAATKNTESFEALSEDYIRTEMPKSFSKVNIESKDDIFINIRIVKDKQFGIKVPKEYKNKISYKIDNNGTLQLSLIKTEGDKYPYLYVIVYSPTVNQISCSKGRGAEIRSNIDSLIVNADNMQSLSIDSATKFEKVNIIANNINDLSIHKAIVGNIKLKLNNSNFTTKLTSYQSLSINAEGNSNIEIFGQDSNSNQYHIKNLFISTTGKSNLEIEHIKIGESNGSFPDSTKVNMPIAYLKQILKSK